MKKLFLTLTFIFGIYAVAAEARSFEAEKAEIDAHVVSQDYRAQITKIYDYTILVLRANDEGRYDAEIAEEALSKVEDKSFDLDKISEERGFKILYGGLRLLAEFKAKEKVEKIDIIGAAEVAAVLFSPELFDKTEDAEKPDFPIYKYAFQNLKTLELAGQFFLDNYQSSSENVDLIRKVYPNYLCKPGFVVTCDYFSPQMFLGEDAVFSEEAALYALSKNVALYGVSHRVNTVHGGIYKYPIFLFAHDQAHMNDILRPGGIFRPKLYTGEQYRQVRDDVVALAGELYELLNNEKIISSEEKPKAVCASFLILHENEVYLSTKMLNRPRYVSGQDGPFKILMRQAKSTLGKRIGVVSALKPWSHMDDEERAVFDANPTPEKSWQHSERNISDYAQMMFELYPDQENQIYGTEKDENRTRVYNGSHVLTLVDETLNWLHSKASGHLN